MSPECTQLRQVIHPFLDGELGVAALTDSERHLATCPACSELVRRHRALAREVRLAMGGPAPEGLRIRTAEFWRQRLRQRRRHWALSSLAAAAVVAIALLFTLAPGRHIDDDDVREVVDLHRRSLLPGHLTEIASDDRTVLAAWFKERLSFAPWIGSAGDDGCTLVGARLDWCEQQRVATLVFRRQDHVINLVTYPAEHPGDAPAVTAASDGLSLCGWVHGRMQYFAVSDLSEADLHSVTAGIREKTERD